MNTRFEYMYRDACNYKWFDEIIVPAMLTLDQLLPFLQDKTFFIPSKIGIPDLQPPDWTENDHIWHEITNINTTQEKPMIDITTEQLLYRFRVAHENKWYELSEKVEKWFL